MALASEAVDQIETHAVDVLAVGAGGAGLRAAIEAQAAGAKVGLVCKSLLGKAHTVMAEGGVAAALANVDAEDRWQTHFRDTMVGGKLLNNPRMAGPRPGGSGPRPRSSRPGARSSIGRRTAESSSDRSAGTPTRGWPMSATGPWGPEMIRTLQDRTVSAGVEALLAHDHAPHHGRSGRHRGIRLLADHRRPVFPAKAVVLATGGIGKAYSVTSNSWSTRATATPWRTRPARTSSTWSSSSSTRRHGLAAGSGPARDRGGPRRGRHPPNKDGKRSMGLPPRGPAVSTPPPTRRPRRG